MDRQERMNQLQDEYKATCDRIFGLTGLTDMESRIETEQYEIRKIKLKDEYNRTRLAQMKDQLEQEYCDKLRGWLSELSDNFTIRFKGSETTTGYRVRCVIRYQDKDVEISQKASLVYSDGSKQFRITGYNDPIREDHWIWIWNKTFELFVSPNGEQKTPVKNKTQLLDAIAKAFAILLEK